MALLGITYLLVANQFNKTVEINRGSGRPIGIGASAPASVASPTPVPLSQPTVLHQQATEELNTLLLMSGISLGVMMVVSVALGWLMAGRVLRPLRVMATTTRQISGESLDKRLDMKGPSDEITHLADTIDGLLGRLESAFDAERRFVANASHELRTPLTLEQALLEVTLADPAATVDSLRATCERVLAASQQQERLIEALMILARSQRGLDRREPFDLATVTGEVLTTRYKEARSRGLDVDAALNQAPAEGDPLLALQLVANLVENAIRYNVPKGWIAVVTGIRSGRAVMSVANSGPVVPPGDADKLVLPFQRQAPDRTRHAEGHGLGLSIVRAIADAHGAALTIRPRAAGGLDIEVIFPALSN
ncbi:MAG: HAMP domain-containing protein [Streptosporangiaceae bacterium]|nr:HAMP domain-containing protein [Streptosporangiaceae bacterium]